MYSKSEFLLNKIKNDIDIYCSIEEKFDFYYLFSVLNKSDLYAKDLLKYAVMMNNETKIGDVLKLMVQLKYQNFEKIQKDIHNLIEENHKFIEYANNFNFDADGAIEILYSINSNNKNFINNL